jgi:hypothetical protein
MIRRRLERHAGNRILVWLLMLIVALMGLTITRQQALGPLHVHQQNVFPDAIPFAVAASDFVGKWLQRWQYQQLHGHTQITMLLVPQATVWPEREPLDFDHARAHQLNAQGHDHNTLQRHHHAANDRSVVALDGAAEPVQTGSSQMLFSVVVASPSVVAVMPLAVALTDSWLVDSTAAFTSLSLPPPWRPPAV